MNPTSWPLLLGGMAIICGGMVLIGMAQIALMLHYRSRGQRVIGKVVRITTDSDNGYSAIIEYDVSGEKFRIEPQLYTYPPLYREGQRIPIYYLSDRPARCRIVCLREYAKFALLSSIGIGLMAILLLAYGGR